MIRAATPGDVPAMLAIYAPYIRETDRDLLSGKSPRSMPIAQRFAAISARYPWIAWEEKRRRARLCLRRRGFFARRLCLGCRPFHLPRPRRPPGEASARGCTAVLCRCCALRGFHNLYGIVTGENSASIRFHERMGFARLGTLPRTGYKLGRWHDVIWFGLRLCPADAPRRAASAGAGAWRRTARQWRAFRAEAVRRRTGRNADVYKSSARTPAAAAVD